MHTAVHCIYTVFFSCPCCPSWLCIIQRWHGRTSSTCTMVWFTITASRRLGFRQVGPALIGPQLPVCAFIFVSSLKHFISNCYPNAHKSITQSITHTLNKDILYKHSYNQKNSGLTINDIKPRFVLLRLTLSEHI